MLWASAHTLLGFCGAGLPPSPPHSSQMSLFRRTFPFLFSSYLCFLSTSNNWPLQRRCHTLSTCPSDVLFMSCPSLCRKPTCMGLSGLWLPVTFIHWGTGRRREGGRKGRLALDSSGSSLRGLGDLGVSLCCGPQPLLVAVSMQAPVQCSRNFLLPLALQA